MTRTETMPGFPSASREWMDNSGFPDAGGNYGLKRAVPRNVIDRVIVQNNPVNRFDPWGLYGIPIPVPNGGPDDPGPLPIGTPPPSNPPLPSISPDDNGFGWNGNLIPYYSRQDSICSLGRIIGAYANSNDCIIRCCQDHDKCYAKYKCNMFSFLIPFSFGGILPCQLCNGEVEECFMNAIMNPNDCLCH